MFQTHRPSPSDENLPWTFTRAHPCASAVRIRTSCCMQKKINKSLASCGRSPSSKLHSPTPSPSFFADNPHAQPLFSPTCSNFRSTQQESRVSLRTVSLCACRGDDPRPGASSRPAVRPSPPRRAPPPSPPWYPARAFPRSRRSPSPSLPAPSATSRAPRSQNGPCSHA